MGELILVIGGTGAQGFEVVKALLGAGKPFSVRVLSRNPDNPRVKEQFKDLPVQLVKGSFTDSKSVGVALQGCYGVYVNTDGFSVNSTNELAAAVAIYEVAARTAGLRHFVWSGADYLLKLGGFNPRYGAHHANAKARFNEFLRSQPSEFSPGRLAWTICNAPAYTDMLQGGLFQPQIAPDNTRIFAYPLAPNSRIPFVTIRDIGAFALAIFLDPLKWSGKMLNIGSHYATGTEIAKAFTQVTGLPSQFVSLQMQQWTEALGERGIAPLIAGDVDGVTMAKNFAMTWPAWEDDVFAERDFKRLVEIHPGIESLEDWMKRTGYDGTEKPFLKVILDRMDSATANSK